MAPLMPSLATGTSVYCPSEGTHGVASATLSRGPEANLVDTTEISPPASNHGAIDSDGPNGDPLAEPPHGRHAQPLLHLHLLHQNVNSLHFMHQRWHHNLMPVLQLTRNNGLRQVLLP